MPYLLAFAAGAMSMWSWKSFFPEHQKENIP